MTISGLAQADPARLAIFLDFDGCLVDLAGRPQDVVVPKRLPALLHRLRRLTGGALAVVSGRPAADIRAFLPGLAVPVRGSHGAERADAHGAIRRIAIDRDALEAAAKVADARLAGRPGLLVERKPVALGLHYRGDRSRGPEVEALAAELLEGLKGYHAHHGKMVIELRPDGVGKGHAVRGLMTAVPFRGRTPVMFGDDATDEPAFAVARAFGGHGVKVGWGQTTAKHRLGGPAAVRELLSRWAANGGGA